MATDGAGGWGHSTKISFCYSLLHTCFPLMLLSSFCSSVPMRITHGLQSLRRGPAPACRNGTRWLISSFLTEWPAALATETHYFMFNTTLLAIFSCLIAGATQSHNSFWRKEASSLFYYGTLMLWKQLIKLLMQNLLVRLSWKLFTSSVFLHKIL